MNSFKLTSAEETIMKALWDKEKAFVKEIIEVLPSPKPAYNTVSTLVRILVQKGVVGYKSFGKSHQYYPLLKREEYTKNVLTGIMNGYFGGSFKKLVSFMSDANDVSLKELDDIIETVKKNKNGS